MYAYLKIVTDILNSSSPVKEQISPLCLSCLLPEFLSYSLLPIFPIFDKCAFLGYYVANNVKFFTKFRNKPDASNIKCQTKGLTLTHFEVSSIKVY
jgi:hypothetical protein